MSERKRVNFSHPEREFLLSLVHKYRNILENKRSDAISACSKKRKWEEVADEFNSADGCRIKRTPEQLRRLHENMKGQLKKQMEENQPVTETGPIVGTSAQAHVLAPNVNFEFSGVFDYDKKQTNESELAARSEYLERKREMSEELHVLKIKELEARIAAALAEKRAHDEHFELAKEKRAYLNDLKIKEETLAED